MNFVGYPSWILRNIFAVLSINLYVLLLLFYQMLSSEMINYFYLRNVLEKFVIFLTSKDAKGAPFLSLQTANLSLSARSIFCDLLNTHLR